MPVKKNIIVVKNLRDLSPKRQIIISRKPTDDEPFDDLEPSLLGNKSPHRPEKGRDGFISRSILGDPQFYEQLELKKKAIGGSNSSYRSYDSSSTDLASRQGGSRMKTKERNIYTGDTDRTSPEEGQDRLKSGSISPRTGGESEESEGGVRDLSPENSFEENPEEYLRAIQRFKALASEVRASESITQLMTEKSMSIIERATSNKEGKVLALWQERQRDWDRIQSSISRRVQAGKNHSLMMATTDEYRARLEEYDLLQAAIPPEERFGSNAWQRTLRGGGARTVAIGHIFSGIECEVEDTFNPPKTVRKPLRLTEASSKKDLGGKTSFIDNTPIIRAKKKQLAKTILSSSAGRTASAFRFLKDCYSF